MSVKTQKFGEIMINHLITFMFLLLFRGSLYAAEYANEEIENERFSENQFEQKESPIILEYPELKKFLYIPPKAPIYIGLGVAPISLMGSKLYFSFSLFQVHYMNDDWDIELFTASVGQARSDKTFANSKHFTVRTSPKYIFMNIFDTGKVSIGPLIGMEYAQFSSIQSYKCKSLCTTVPEDLTTGGMIYGLSLSETFTLSKDRKFKISQIFYKQTYNIRENEYNWRNDPIPSQASVFDGAANEDEISKKNVFMIEFSFLF